MESGYTVGGMVSREVRSHGARIGFEIQDLASSDSGWLAHVNGKTGPHVGKYRVNLEDLEKVGVNAIREALQKMNVVAIDEIGPMELFSKDFREAVRDAFDSCRLVIGIVHRARSNELAREARFRGDAETYVVTRDNRDDISEIVTKMAFEYLRFLQGVS